MIYQVPSTHIQSQAEKRVISEIKRNWAHPHLRITNILLEGDAGSGKTELAKALSAALNLPYTKITCFADMDKSDVIGAVLPQLGNESDTVRYQFYPSEIVRAYENGWLLEIQEPTVIRDAAVLMMLNSALEADGAINLPDRMVRRHPDFVAVITTNRGYNGCRPLNEALRDRIQHTEKMDLPPKEVMMARAAAQTGCQDEGILGLLADCIIALDETAKANGIKGVAGMRSYLYWTDAVCQGAKAREEMYQKVIYKITTNENEIALLLKTLEAKGLNRQLEGLVIHSTQDGAFHQSGVENKNALFLERSQDSTGENDTESTQAQKTKAAHSPGGTSPIYHELASPPAFKKFLNQQARESVKGSCHEKIRLIVHREEPTSKDKKAYELAARELMPVIGEMVRRTKPLLEYDLAADFKKAQLFGTQFSADRVAMQDLRTFKRKDIPQEKPKLAVALRIDESASMAAFGRLDAARQTAIALYEFCTAVGIPISIYGDTADKSPLEQMSLFAYVDSASLDPNDKYTLMGIKGRSNNRDGMALRIVADRLLTATEETKLLISLSDGQPKALPDYTGKTAMEDMQSALQSYRRQGITFLACAIGQDKETIKAIYGSEHTLDITDLSLLPTQLVSVILRLM